MSYEHNRDLGRRQDRSLERVPVNRRTFSSRAVPDRLLVRSVPEEGVEEVEGGWAFQDVQVFVHAHVVGRQRQTVRERFTGAVLNTTATGDDYPMSESLRMAWIVAHATELIETDSVTPARM